MTIQKIIILSGILLALALPSGLFAGAMNGADWYSTESDTATNTIERVIPSDSSVAQSEIGQDWYNGDEVISENQGNNSYSLSPEEVRGIGLDWHSDKEVTPAGSAGDCLAMGALADGVKKC